MLPPRHRFISGNAGLLGGAAAASLFICAGQSNASGHLLTSAMVPANLQVLDAGIKIWTGAAFATLNNGTNNGGSSVGEWGPEAEFARLFRLDNPSTTIYLVKHTRDGSASPNFDSAIGTSSGQDWAPASAELFSAAKTKVTNALSNLSGSGITAQLKAVLWMQGEADAQDTTLASAYQTNFSTLEAAIRAQWGMSTTKILMGRITTNWTFASTVRTAQTAIAAASPTLDLLLDTDTYPLQGDTIHYTAGGQVLLGQDMYRAYTNPVTYWRPAWSSSFDTRNTGIENYSIRNIIPSTSLLRGGSQLRVTVTGSPDGTCQVRNVSIVERSGSTANGVTTPTEILFSGASGFSMGNTVLVSDTLAYTLNPAKDYLLILDIAATNGNISNKTTGDGAYFKSGTQSYNQQNVAGFSTGASSYVTSRIEVFV